MAEEIAFAAALVDGYTRLQAFFKIVLPQAVTGIAATTVFCLIFAWNEYAFALMLTSEKARTAPPSIATMLGSGGLEWSAQEFADEDHGSVVLPSHYYGLRSIFSEWLLPVDEKTGRVIGGVPELKAHFERLSLRFGYTVMPSEQATNLLGYNLVSEKRYAEAIEVFEMNVRNYPDSANVYDSLGEGLEAADRLGEARESFRKAVELGRKNGDQSYNNMGIILIDNGQVVEGILKFKEAIRLKPKYYDAHFNLGLAYFKKGLFDASLDEFKLAISYEPDHAEAYSCLGTVYANKGLFDEAIRAIEKAIQLRPDYSHAYKNLGIIYLNYKKDVHKAVSLFREFLRLDPKNKEAEMIVNTKRNSGITIERLFALQATKNALSYIAIVK